MSINANLYVTPVLQNKEKEFLDFLRSLKIQKEQIKRLTKNNHYYMYEISLPNTSIVQVLNDNQVRFI